MNLRTEIRPRPGPQLSLTGCLLWSLVGTSQIAAAAPQLGLGLTMFGRGSNEGAANSRVAGSEIEASFSHHFDQYVQVDFQGLLKVETGSSRQLQRQEFSPQSAFRLNESSVSIRPLSFLEFSFGALNQDRWKNPLLLDGQTFPGILEKIEWGNSFFVRLEALQSFAADTAQMLPWNEPANPGRFFFERITVGGKPLEQLKVVLNVSHFLFNDLSPEAAFLSATLGNSVNGYAVSSSRFINGFTGFEAGSSLQFKWSSRMQAEASLAGLINTATSADRNIGWRALFGVTYQLNEQISFRPTVEWFEQASDVSPAIFNSRSRGHNNRQGFGVGLLARLQNPDLALAAEWFDSATKASSPFQNSLSWFQSSLRSQYAIL